MSELFPCTFCMKVEFDSKIKLGGHLSSCIKRKEILDKNAFDVDLANHLANNIISEEMLTDTQRDYEFEVEEIPYESKDIDITNPKFIEAYESATNAYLTRQREFFNVEDY